MLNVIYSSKETLLGLDKVNPGLAMASYRFIMLKAKSQNSPLDYGQLRKEFSESATRIVNAYTPFTWKNHKILATAFGLIAPCSKCKNGHIEVGFDCEKAKTIDEAKVILGLEIGKSDKDCKLCGKTIDLTGAEGETLFDEHLREHDPMLNYWNELGHFSECWNVLKGITNNYE